VHDDKHCHDLGTYIFHTAIIWRTVLQYRLPDAQQLPIVA
jgi:hypothetical protein